MSKQQQGIGFAVTALVLGIVAFLTGFIFVGPFLGVLALIFGIIALNKNTLKPMSIVGIVLGSLAIVFGTIFSIAFLALPALQSSQRDTALKNDVSTVATAISEYRSNHQGALPTTDELQSQGLDLSQGDQVVVSDFTTSTVSPGIDTILVVTGATCNDETSFVAQGVSPASASSSAIIAKLEAGGGIYYCLSSE